MNKKITTIKDIAKALQIAPSTVSKALRESSDISEEMRVKVKKAAVKMNYTPNYMAQRLRDRKTRILAVIVPDISDSFYSSVIDGMEEIAFRKGYNLMVHKSGESYHREQLLVQSLLSHVDGLIISLSAETKKFEHLRQLKQKNIPLVLFDRYSNKINCSKVIFNDEKISFAITEQLIKSGCRRIAYITGPQELSTFESRVNGYREALIKNSIEVDNALLFPTKLSSQQGKQAFHALMHLQHKPDAIIADNSGLLLAVHAEMKKILPQEQAISLAALDYNDLYSYLTPPITSVSQKGFEIGSLSAQTCITEIESNEKTKVSQQIVSSQLIVRTSGQNEINPDSQKTTFNSSYTSEEEIIYVY